MLFNRMNCPIQIRNPLRTISFLVSLPLDERLIYMNLAINALILRGIYKIQIQRA